MWVFYLFSLLLTVGMVILTLRYFAGPGVPRYVFSTVAYTWFCSLSMIILVPADIWISLHEKIGHENGAISFFWSWTYWSTFLLTWAVVPLIQGYEDAGDFTMTEKLKTSVHVNLVFYLILGAVGLFGLILLVIMKKNWFGKLKAARAAFNAGIDSGITFFDTAEVYGARLSLGAINSETLLGRDEGVLGFAMASSNTFGLVTGAFLLGFGLSEIPKSIWRNADWSIRQKVLSHKIAKMAVKLDDAHQEFSNAIVVAQATSNQMSKRDPLRRYMDVIDGMLYQMFKEDPNFKPQGGRLGENDMDYDTDAKSMATLRRNLRIAREEYYRYKSEYMTYVMEALELEDTIKNYECRYATGWIFISSFRPSRTGTIGLLFDKLELVWRCILRKQLERLFAIILGCLSATILLAEATLLTNRVDLFLFSKLINSVADEEMLVQVYAFLPLMYMCVCTYYSLFQIGMLMFYSLTPRQTSSISLLMICSMVARYAPPISYNYLNLIRLDDDKITVFEKRMGNIDRAVPFFGKGFNKIYPLIMVIYTLLVASNFFDRVIRFFGNWKRLRFQTEADDTDGSDPSGLIILQRERTWLEQGHRVGEQVIPLARNFNNTSVDVEASSDGMGKTAVEMKAASSLNADNIRSSPSKPPIDEDYGYGSTRDAISNKYAVRREKIRQGSAPIPVDKNMVKASLLATDNSETGTSEGAPRGIAAKWESVKTGFRSFKANIGAKKFLPLRQVQEGTLVSRVSSSEKLDEIFKRLKRPALDHEMNSDDDEDSGLDIKVGGPIR